MVYMKKTVILLSSDLKKLFKTKIPTEIEDKINELNICDDNWFENKTFITRSILQLVGSEIFRDRVSNSYWVDLVKEKCENSESDFIIITDCRFESEIYGMCSDNYNIITIRLLRDVNKGKNKHQSEIALDNFQNWNYIIDNKKIKLSTFEKQIIKVADDIIKEIENF
jgi:hypothetical protein